MHFNKNPLCAYILLSLRRTKRCDRPLQVLAASVELYESGPKCLLVVTDKISGGMRNGVSRVRREN